MESEIAIGLFTFPLGQSIAGLGFLRAQSRDRYRRTIERMFDLTMRAADSVIEAELPSTEDGKIVGGIEPLNRWSLALWRVSRAFREMWKHAELELQDRKLLSVAKRINDIAQDAFKALRGALKEGRVDVNAHNILTACAERAELLMFQISAKLGGRVGPTELRKRLDEFKKDWEMSTVSRNVVDDLARAQ